MRDSYQSKLDRRKRYLQVALNSTLDDARQIIARLPISDRIIVEAGTPLIKRYGMDGIRRIRTWFEQRISGLATDGSVGVPATAAGWASYFIGHETAQTFEELAQAFRGGPRRSIATEKKSAASTTTTTPATKPWPYVVADLKTMDRGQTEVEMVAAAGASAAVALGSSPVETLNSFIAACEANGLDAMIDMMNVDYPLSVLRALKKVPPVVILHRGVDEERDNREKQIPLHEIRRIKGNYDIMISIAGGDTSREVQRAVFNDADIVVIWKSVYTSSQATLDMVQGFLKDIK